MFADALTPDVTRSSAAMVFIIYVKQGFVFHEKMFANACTISIQRNDRKYKYISVFPENNSARK